ncbi:hypothetical protein BP00DRAFT_444495 [Aspergillus indologenus CBS 114.80]|uniref:ARM repeat-containing protein n=1 Tax=Aspergillus indologenus CBS 114.80 TaxID=1450541 RepID=A0A2V5J6L5_9EURO|nr:hypothetical protein BP00DRAFT_444495 [Aspergillus indologenus CBS 114.80]
MRKAVVEGLLQKGYLSESTVHDIALLLKHCELDLRHTFMRAMAPVSHLPERIVKVLLQFFKDDLGDDLIVGGSGSPALSLRPQDKLSANTIRCLGTFLKDELTLVEYRAARALEVKDTMLPCWVNQGLVDLLADHDDRMRRAAYNSLCCQQSLPEQTLYTLISMLSAEAKCEDPIHKEKTEQAIGRLLKAKNLYTRLVAGWALAPQINLEDEIMDDIALLLEHDDPSLRRKTLMKLLGLKHFRERVLRCLRVELKSPDVEAAFALVAQPHLAENILHDLALLVCASESRMSYDDPYHGLFQRSDLPRRTVQALASRLEDGPDSRLWDLLRSQDSFYALLPNLGRRELLTIFTQWIRVAFHEQICCFIYDGYLVTDGPKGRFKAAFATAQHRKQFLQTLRDAHATVGLFYDQTRPYSRVPDCAADMETGGTRGTTLLDRIRGLRRAVLI